MKTKGKISTKLLTSKITILTKIVASSGIGNNNAPASVVDYAFDQLDNPSGDVRTAAIGLIAACSSTAQDKVNARM